MNLEENKLNHLSSRLVLKNIVTHKHIQAHILLLSVQYSTYSLSVSVSKQLKYHKGRLMWCLSTP